MSGCFFVKLATIGVQYTDEWFPARGNFVPRRPLLISGDVFGLHSQGGMLQYLVGRDQGCCSASYYAQDSPPQERIIRPKVSIKLKWRTYGLSPLIHLKLHNGDLVSFLQWAQLVFGCSFNGGVYKERMSFSLVTGFQKMSFTQISLWYYIKLTSLSLPPFFLFPYLSPFSALL